MAKDEGRNMALVLLGIVAIIAVVGLVLLYTGSKTGGSIGVYQRGQYYPSPEEACVRAIQCQNGIGAQLLQVDPEDPSVSICVCAEHHQAETIYGWTQLNRGQDPTPLYIPTQHYWKVQWRPQTSTFLDQDGRRIAPVYEEPGTYPAGYYGDSRIS